jgi:preprotein translocase subunit YajC
MVVLFVPLLFGVPGLYAWARPGGLEGHDTAQFLHVYLRVPFFLGRTGFYFVVWLVLAFFLNRWSYQQEQAHDTEVIGSRYRRLGLLSGVGLVLYGLTTTFAAVDWMMSLEPHWFSTIYGFLIVTGQLLAATAFAIMVTAWLAHDEPLASVASPALFHDLGNLLLAFVLLWAYTAFSQLLITWSGDLPEEIRWYLHRSRGGWDWVRLLLLMLHFALPFFLLLSRQTKRRRQFLPAVAALVFCMHLLDVFWLVMPAFFPEQLRVHWLDLAVPIGIGGLWLAAFLWQLQRRSLLPWHEPRLQEVVQHD